MENLADIKFSDDLLDLDIDFEDKSTYTHNGSIVPRVTHILKACLDDSNLIKWAGNIPPSMYNNISDGAKRVGTEVHEQIDYFLNNGVSNVDFFNPLLSSKDMDKVDTAVHNFKAWFNRLTDWGYRVEEVVGLEIPVSCPWYGGTVDGILKINSKYYIVDFKTSKKISLEYLLQVSAYMWIINNGYMPGLPHIDGIGIIRVDKATYDSYEDLFLNEHIPEQMFYINQYQRCFCSLVDSYYRSLYSENLFNEYNKVYKFSNSVG